MAPTLPVTLGRYVLHRELASGGMAAVFFARLLGASGFARTVAVKRPHAHLLSDRSFAMMLIDEARLASRIRHPNVVSTLDVIETPTALALVMDYVHGESLGRLSAAARALGEHVPIPIAAAILIDALHGMHAAHEATDEQSGGPLNIVHRDISPQNLLVGADGITRIVDFGIAKAAGRLLTTRDGAVKGKFAYMAPEQIRGQPVSRQTDIFAASIVLWELLTGDWLYRSANEGEAIYKALQGAVEAPSTRNPSIPPAFDAIVLRGLAREAGERYPTAREMAVNLERVAPAVRPSEIGAWVQRLAGDVLADRAAIIAEMERSVSGMEPDLTLPAPSSPAGSSGATPSARTPASGEHSQVSHAGVVAERLPPTTPSSRLRRQLAWGAFGAMFVTLGSAATWIARGSPAQVAADAAPAPVLLATSAPPPVPAPPPPSAAGSAAPASSLTRAAPPPPAPSAAPSASASAKPAARPHSKRAPSGACDPPYIVDAQGREVFKEQCL